MRQRNRDLLKKKTTVAPLGRSFEKGFRLRKVEDHCCGNETEQALFRYRNVTKPFGALFRHRNVTKPFGALFRSTKTKPGPQK